MAGPGWVLLSPPPPLLPLLLLLLLPPLPLLCSADTAPSPCEQKYFSGGRQPHGAPFVADGRRVGICQRYEAVDYFYTLFDTRYRIPVYSAYVPAPVPAGGARSGRRRTGRWYVEHSLAPVANGTQVRRHSHSGETHRVAIRQLGQLRQRERRLEAILSAHTSKRQFTPPCTTTVSL